MPPDGDPYLYPGTTTLKNKLGLRDPAALERAQDERAAARYAILERNLPQPPFTFDTLKDVQEVRWNAPRTPAINEGHLVFTR
jgi:fido (protein-threonine AMPylation protein)